MPSIGSEGTFWLSPTAVRTGAGAVGTSIATYGTLPVCLLNAIQRRNATDGGRNEEAVNECANHLPDLRRPHRAARA